MLRDAKTHGAVMAVTVDDVDAAGAVTDFRDVCATAVLWSGKVWGVLQ